MRIQPVNTFQFNQQTMKLNKVQNTPEDVQTSESMYSKGMSQLCFGAVVPIRTSFAKEIAEQPKVLKNIFDGFFKESGKISGININLTKNELEKATAINIVASGSSKNAGEMAKSFMEETVQLPVNIMSASEFITSKPKLNKNDIMVFVSQSGNTADTLDALNYSKSKGLKSIAITNNTDSKIHKAADFAIDMQAGIENAVAATKTVTSSVANLWGIGMKLGEIKGTFSVLSENGAKYVEELKQLPNKIESMIKDTANINRIAEDAASRDNFYLLAKEPNLGAVNEGALKLTETTQKRVIPGSSSEFMHGLFTSIKPFDVYLQVASGKGKAYDLSVENFAEIVKKRNSQNPILMKSETNKLVEKQLPNAEFIDIPDTLDEFTPLLATVRFQQFTNAITKRLGINPDNGGGVLTKYRQNLSM